MRTNVLQFLSEDLLNHDAPFVLEQRKAPLPLLPTLGEVGATLADIRWWRFMLIYAYYARCERLFVPETEGRQYFTATQFALWTRRSLS